LDKEQLLQQLVEKLKGKSVYKTLIQITRDENVPRTRALKGLFSLGTHLVIEIEQGGKQYECLLEDIYNRLGQLIYGKEDV